MASFWLPSGHGKEELDRLNKAASAALNAGREFGPLDSSSDREEMRMSRFAALKKQAFGGEISYAAGKFQDPMWYWRANNLPFDYKKEEELVRIRSYTELIYATHPVIASCIDIFSSWPLTGMHLSSKMPELVDFYSDHFFNGLNYEEYCEDVLRQYWCVGEAFPLGQFNELLGVWDDDELIHPNDVKVIKTPFSKEPRFKMRIPETIRNILQNPDQDTQWEAQKLRQAYPELVKYAQTNEFMPVSNILMKQVAYKADYFNDRGVSILMRAFRSLRQEEMLNSAIDSVASRLYTPLILAKIGAPASDLGTSAPWIPTPEDLTNFESRLDASLAADFRVLITHFATSMESVFGREVMPDFSGDYDRIIDRQLQAFGLSRTMLTGADSGETYAADALNRDIVTVKLKRAQKIIKKLYDSRAKIVAEANQHYDYEERGGKKFVKMEEVLVVDEKGNKKIVEQPKLLWPQMEFDVLNLQNQEQQRQFVEALRASGVPISNQTRLTNIEIDLDEEYELVQQEAIRMAVETQETRRLTYLELKQKNLPIPQDLRDDFDPKVLNADEIAAQQSADEGLPLPNPIFDVPAETAAFVPTMEDYMQGDDTQDAPAQDPPVINRQMAPVILPPSRPPESDEQRATMPRQSSLHFPELVGSGETDVEEISKTSSEEYYPLIYGPRFLLERQRYE